MGEIMPNWLVQRASLTPNRIAIVYKEMKWTFQQLFDETIAIQKRLSIKQSERVAVLINNNPDSVALIHALQLCGAETIFLNHKLTSEELAYILEDSEATQLIFMDGFAKKAEQLKKLHPIISIECLERIKQKEQEDKRMQTEVILHDTCSIMYTSGTTGRPKGVMQTYGNHWWSANASALNIGLSMNDSWLCVVPIFHISGLSILFRSVIYGIPVYLLEQFDEKEVNSLLMSGKVTIMSAVSTMLIRMLQQLGGHKYHDHFRCMLLGGSSAYPELLKKCKDKSIPVFQTYGMTETSSQVVTLSPEFSLEKLGSAGKPLFPNQIKIVQEDNNEDGIGEIWIKGPTVTKGYLHNKGAQSFVDGWFKSGDLGYMDVDGFIYIVDRRSDLIVSGGENIYPAEIEAALLKHPNIIEVGVTGVEDAMWGRVPYAFIVSEKNLSNESLMEFCKQYLASYKIPKQFIQIHELPKNASNKILRRELIKYVDQHLQ